MLRICVLYFAAHCVTLHTTNAKELCNMFDTYARLRYQYTDMPHVLRVYLMAERIIITNTAAAEDANIILFVPACGAEIQYTT